LYKLLGTRQVGKRPAGCCDYLIAQGDDDVRRELIPHLGVEIAEPKVLGKAVSTNDRTANLPLSEQGCERRWEKRSSLGRVQFRS
jgi:hypothetical protein